MTPREPFVRGNKALKIMEAETEAETTVPWISQEKFCLVLEFILAALIYMYCMYFSYWSKKI